MTAAIGYYLPQLQSAQESTKMAVAASQSFGTPHGMAAAMPSSASRWGARPQNQSLPNLYNLISSDINPVFTPQVL